MNNAQPTAQEPMQRRMKLMRFVTHVIVLVIVFVLPEVLMSLGRTVPGFVYVHTVSYILVFYINYYWLVDKYLFNKNRIWFYFLINLLFVVLFLFVIFAVHYYMYPPMLPAGKGAAVPPPHIHGPQGMGGLLPMMQSFSRDCLMMMLSMCICIALKFSEKWLRWERMEQKMVTEQKEIELKNLKNQLNPHFLFNTLNNIYALIGISQERAQYAVHELSQLLRYVLYESGMRMVPLDREMLFVKNYIALMRLRLSSQVTLKVAIDESQGVGLQIAPLMFISLVENAFKHGVSASNQSLIDIRISVVGDSVVCQVDNSYFPKDDNDRSGSGIGITNLKQQLSILYAGRHSLRQAVEDGMYKTRLEIKLLNNAQNQ